MREDTRVDNSVRLREESRDDKSVKMREKRSTMGDNGFAEVVVSAMVVNVTGLSDSDSIGNVVL